MSISITTKKWFGTTFGAGENPKASDSAFNFDKLNEDFALDPVNLSGSSSARELGYFTLKSSTSSLIVTSQTLTITKGGTNYTTTQLLADFGIDIKFVTSTPSSGDTKSFKITADEASIQKLEDFIDGGETLRFSYNFAYTEAGGGSGNLGGFSELVGVNEAADFVDASIKNALNVNSDSLVLNETDLPGGTSPYTIFKFKMADDAAVNNNTIINDYSVTDENGDALPFSFAKNTDYKVEYNTATQEFFLNLTSAGRAKLKANADSGEVLDLKFKVIAKDTGDVAGNVGDNKKTTEQIFNLSINGLTPPEIIAPANATINENLLSTGATFKDLAVFELKDENGAFNIALNSPANTLVTGGNFGAFNLVKNTDYTIVQYTDQTTGKHHAAFRVTEAGELKLKSNANSGQNLSFKLQLTGTDPDTQAVSNTGETTVTVKGVSNSATTAIATASAGADQSGANYFSLGITTYDESELVLPGGNFFNIFILGSIAVTDNDKIQNISNVKLLVDGTNFGITLINGTDYGIFDPNTFGGLYSNNHRTGTVSYYLTQSGIDKIRTTLDDSQLLKLKATFDILDFNGETDSYTHSFRVDGETSVDLLGATNFEVYESQIATSGLIKEWTIVGANNYNITIEGPSVANSDSNDAINYTDFFDIVVDSVTDKVKLYIKPSKVQEFKNILDGTTNLFVPSDTSTLTFQIKVTDPANLNPTVIFDLSSKFIGDTDSVTAVLNDFSTGAYDLVTNEPTPSSTLVVDMNQFISDAEFGYGNLRVNKPGMQAPIATVFKVDASGQSTQVTTTSTSASFGNNNVTISGLPDLNTGEYFKIKITYNATSLIDGEVKSGQVHLKVNGFTGSPPTISGPNSINITEIESTPADPSSPSNSLDVPINSKWDVSGGTISGTPVIVAVSGSDAKDITHLLFTDSAFATSKFGIQTTATSVSININNGNKAYLSKFIDDGDNVKFKIKFNVLASDGITIVPVEKEINLIGSFNSLTDYDNSIAEVLSGSVAEDYEVTQGTDNPATLSFVNDEEPNVSSSVTYSDFTFTYTKVDAAGQNNGTNQLVLVLGTDYTYDPATKLFTLKPTSTALPDIAAGEYYLVQVHAKGTSGYDGDFQNISYVVKINGDTTASITLDPSFTLTNGAILYSNEDALIGDQVIAKVNVTDNDIANITYTLTVDATSDAKQNGPIVNPITLSLTLGVHYTFTESVIAGGKSVELKLTPDGVLYLQQQLSTNEEYIANLTVTETDSAGVQTTETFKIRINGNNDAPIIVDNVSSQETYTFADVVEGDATIASDSHLASFELTDYDDDLNPILPHSTPLGNSTVHVDVYINGSTTPISFNSFGGNNPYFTLTQVKISTEATHNYDEFKYVITFKPDGKAAFEADFLQNANEADVTFEIFSRDSSGNEVSEAKEITITLDVIPTDTAPVITEATRQGDDNPDNFVIRVDETGFSANGIGSKLYQFTIEDDQPINLQEIDYPHQITFTYGNNQTLVLSDGLSGGIAHFSSNYSTGFSNGVNNATAYFWLTQAGYDEIHTKIGNLSALATFTISYNDGINPAVTKDVTFAINNPPIPNVAPDFLNITSPDDQDAVNTSITIDESDVKTGSINPLVNPLFKVVLTDDVPVIDITKIEINKGTPNEGKIVFTAPDGTTLMLSLGTDIKLSYNAASPSELNYYIDASAQSKIDTFKASLDQGETATATFEFKYTDAGTLSDMQTYTIKINGESPSNNDSTAVVGYNGGDDNFEDSNLGAGSLISFIEPSDPQDVAFQHVTVSGTPTITPSSGTFPHSFWSLFAFDTNNGLITVKSAQAAAAIKLAINNGEYIDVTVPVTTEITDGDGNVTILNLNETFRISDTGGSLVGGGGGGGNDPAGVMMQLLTPISIDWIGNTEDFYDADYLGSGANYLLGKFTLSGFPDIMDSVTTTGQGGTTIINTDYLNFSITSSTFPGSVTNGDLILVPHMNGLSVEYFELYISQASLAEFDITPQMVKDLTINISATPPTGDSADYDFTPTFHDGSNNNDPVPVINDATHANDTNQDLFVVDINETDLSSGSELFTFQVTDNDVPIITPGVPVTIVDSIIFTYGNGQTITLIKDTHFEMIGSGSSGPNAFNLTMAVNLTLPGYTLINNNIGNSPATAKFNISYDDGINQAVIKEVTINLNGGLTNTPPTIDWVNINSIDFNEADITLNTNLAELNIGDNDLSSLTANLDSQLTKLINSNVFTDAAGTTHVFGDFFALVTDLPNGKAYIRVKDQDALDLLKNVLTQGELGVVQFKLEVNDQDPSHTATLVGGFNITGENANAEPDINLDSSFNNDVSYTEAELSAGMTLGTWNATDSDGTITNYEIVAGTKTLSAEFGGLNFDTYFEVVDDNVNNKISIKLKPLSQAQLDTLKSALSTGETGAVTVKVKATDDQGGTEEVDMVVNIVGNTPTADPAPQIINIASPIGSYDALTSTVSLDEATLAVNSQLLKFQITDDTNINLAEITDGTEITFAYTGGSITLTQGAGIGLGDYYTTILQVGNNKTQEVIYKLTAQGLGKIATATGLDNGDVASGTLTVNYTDGTTPITKTFNLNIAGETNQNIDITSLTAVNNIQAAQITEQTLLGTFQVTDDNAIALSQLKPKLDFDDGTNVFTLGFGNFSVTKNATTGLYEIRLNSTGVASLEGAISTISFGNLAFTLSVNATAVVGETDTETTNMTMQHTSQVILDVFDGDATDNSKESDVVANYEIGRFHASDDTMLDADNFEITLSDGTSFTLQGDDNFDVLKVSGTNNDAIYKITLTGDGYLALKDHYDQVDDPTTSIDFTVTVNAHNDANTEDDIEEFIWNLQDDSTPSSGWVTNADINDGINLQAILSNSSTQVFNFAELTYDAPGSSIVKTEGATPVNVLAGTIDPGCVPNNQSFISSNNTYSGDIGTGNWMLSRLGMEQIYSAMQANAGNDYLKLSVTLNMYTGMHSNPSDTDSYTFEVNIYENAAAINEWS